MNKEELMKMARDSGLDTSYSDYEKWVGWSGDVINFANAILERAAVECDELSKCMQQDDHTQGCMDSAHAIRELKTQGE